MSIASKTALALLALAPSAWAGPAMGTGSNAIPRSAYTAGGSSATTSANTLFFTVAEEVVFSTGASTNYKARAGLPTIEYFPDPVASLGMVMDNSASTASVTWTTPGFDGARGVLQTGSSYLIQSATYTTPDVFADTAFVSVQVSTSGKAIGSVVGQFFSGLLANTSYFVQVRAVDNDGDVAFPVKSTATTLALPPVVGASEFLMVSPSTYSLAVGSVTVAWIGGQLSPPDASSMSTGGYILQASSDNFGAIALPTPAPVFSSATYSVLASTLTVGTTAPLDLTATYYFRVASLNWIGQPNWSSFGRLNFQITQSTGLIHLGVMDPDVARSTVSTSSMVVTNVGNWPVTVSLTASTATAGGSPWGLYTVTGVETATLQGVFNSGSVGPPHSAFSTYLTSSPTVSQTGGNFAGNQTGVQIPAGQSRTLWFRFTMPDSSDSLGPETIKVTPTPLYP